MLTLLNWTTSNFNRVTGILTKLRYRFPNIEHLIFKETNVTCLGQTNALAEIKGLTLLYTYLECNLLELTKLHKTVNKLNRVGIVIQMLLI